MCNTDNSAITIHIVSAHLNMSLEYCGPQIKRAMSRWHGLWDTASAAIDESALLKLGLVRHAPETSMFMSAYTDEVMKGSTHPYLMSVGHETMEELFSFLVQCADRG